MNRYHLTAHFVEEQRKGFRVAHTIDLESNSNEQINKRAMDFLSDYNHNYCDSLLFTVVELGEKDLYKESQIKGNEV